MKMLKISEFAKLSGVTVKAIRGYEEKGLLRPNRGIESNYRLYSEELICTVQNIKSLQNLGFSLREILIIESSKDFQSMDLKEIFINQLETTCKQLKTLTERRDILNNIIDKFDDLKDLDSSFLTAKEKDVFMGITTGFTKLDQLLSSDVSNQLIAIAARPGLGKTALTVHIAHHLMTQLDKPICFFSTEFDHREWVERLAVQKCEVDRFDDVSIEAESDLELARKTISKRPIFYRNSKNINVDEIVEEVLNISKPIAGVFIDYYQDISGDLETKSSKLKKLATELSCPIFLISTISKSAEERVASIPLPEDLVDFTSMQPHLDKLIIISRDPNLDLGDSKKIADLNVYSQGFSRSDRIRLVWDGKYCGYSEGL